MCKKELAFLKECLRVEVIGGKDKKFSWFRTFRSYYWQPKRRFLFWWRIASYLYSTDNKLKKNIAKKINWKLFFKYGCEIELGAKIGTGLRIPHFSGIVITQYSTIGKNFIIRQNTTIGLKNSNTNTVTIGDDVNIGANSCIISENITIGDNVTIGAMSFVNKDIAPNSIYYTKQESVTRCDTIPSI